MIKPPRKTSYRSRLGAIKLRYDKKAGTMTYVQHGGNQSAVDRNGLSLDTYIHAIYGLLAQRNLGEVLMIGCGGGTLARMLSRDGVKVTVVDIDKTSFTLAQRHFALPKEVECRVADGLAFVQRTRRQFDALIVDAFIGETIPDHLASDSFCRAARRCVRKKGALLMNVCLNDRQDTTADGLAERFADNGWLVRLLDQRGTARNAIVLAGEVKEFRRPRLLSLPAVDLKRIKRELGGMHFRRIRRP